MIEKINEVEGGLEMFFNQYTSSDKKQYDETLKSYNKMNEKFNNAEVLIKSLLEALKATEDKLDFAQEAFNDTSSCSESEIINGSLKDLYAQYKEVSSQQSSEIELQKSLLKSKNDIIQVYKNEINQRKLDVSLYESVIYNEQLKKTSEHEIETEKKKFEKVSSELDICKENYNKAEIEYKNACEKLRNYGEPMPEVTIKPDFEDRRTRINNEHEQLSSRIKAVSDLIVVIDRVTDRIKDAMDIVQRRETAVTVELEKDLHKQFEKLKSEWKENWREFNSLLKQSGEQLDYVIRDFQNDEYGLSQSLNNIYNLMNNKRGESIYSAKEMTDKYIDSAHKMSLKLKEDLSGIERDKKDLVHHCLLHAEQIYGGLLQLVKGSKITVYENKNPKNMLKIDIPEKFDRDSAEKYIDLEIEKSVDSFVNTDFASENKKRKEADKIVSSGRLLRTAIQKNNLTVRAFKVDQSADNASYRTWEESLVNNSGAEKFIVYLSIIVSIMNYSKSEASGIQNNSVFSTLILDNPFGSTTSPHILLPMFNLAEHFKVQMICLTHITQNDVVKCFDNVIKIFLKKMAMSSKEIIVQEKETDNETIAHGFYSISEQLSLF